MDRSSSESGRRLDRAAMLLSGLCLLHCLLLPVVVGALPFVGQFGNGHFHLQMLAFVVPISVMAFALGLPRHHNLAVIVWGGIGMLLLIVGGTIVHSRFGLAADRLFTVLGALTLAAAHFANSRLMRRCHNLQVDLH